jgi:hypothetical protein
MSGYHSEFELREPVPTVTSLAGTRSFHDEKRAILGSIVAIGALEDLCRPVGGLLA